MSADIATRLRDCFERQDRAMRQIEEDLLQWKKKARPWPEDELVDLEDLQRRHTAVINPLHEEFRCLMNEWHTADLPEREREALRKPVRDLAKRADRVRDLQLELESQAGAQLAVVARSIEELRRGRKQARDYAGPGGDDASNLDRRA